MITASGIRSALTAQSFTAISSTDREGVWHFIMTSLNGYRFEVSIYLDGSMRVEVPQGTFNRNQHSLWAADQHRLAEALSAVALL
jgi:hypothetical protein